MKLSNFREFDMSDHMSVTVPFREISAVVEVSIHHGHDVDEDGCPCITFIVHQHAAPWIGRGITIHRANDHAGEPGFPGADDRDCCVHVYRQVGSPDVPEPVAYERIPVVDGPLEAAVREYLTGNGGCPHAPIHCDLPAVERVLRALADDIAPELAAHVLATAPAAPPAGSMN